MTEDSMAVGLAGMAQVGNPRQPMDEAAIRGFLNISATGTTKGISRPRYAQQVTDPALWPHVEPKPTMVTGTSGARYGIRVKIPVLAPPEAGRTQANGRIIRGRGTGNSFWAGSAS